MKHDKYQFLEYVGRSLFTEKFKGIPKETIYTSTDRTAKFDLIIKGGDSNKYVEIKTNKVAIHPTEDNYITKSDYDYLVHNTPVGSKALYVIFDDDRCLVYDLKAIHHLGLIYTDMRQNFKRQLDKESLVDEEFIYLQFRECIQNKVLKIYPKSGSQKLFNFSIKRTLELFANDYISDEYIDEIIDKIRTKIK